MFAFACTSLSPGTKRRSFYWRPVPHVDGFAPGDSNYRYIWSQLPEPHPRARGAATSYQAPQDKQKTWAKAGWNTERE